jgi:hypothetical protein
MDGARERAIAVALDVNPDHRLPPPASLVQSYAIPGLHPRLYADVRPRTETDERCVKYVSLPSQSPLWA